MAEPAGAGPPAAAGAAAATGLAATEGLAATRAGAGLTATTGAGLTAGFAATLGAGLAATTVGGGAGEALVEGVDVLAEGTVGAHAISASVSSANPEAARGALALIVQAVAVRGGLVIIVQARAQFICPAGNRVPDQRAGVLYHLMHQTFV